MVAEATLDWQWLEWLQKPHLTDHGWNGCWSHTWLTMVGMVAEATLDWPWLIRLLKPHLTDHGWNGCWSHIWLTMVGMVSEAILDWPWLGWLLKPHLTDHGWNGYWRYYHGQWFLKPYLTDHGWDVFWSHTWLTMVGMVSVECLRLSSLMTMVNTVAIVDRNSFWSYFIDHGQSLFWYQLESLILKPQLKMQ